MADPVPAAATCPPAHAGANCVYELRVDSTQHLPPCPSCGNGDWKTESGGDAAEDPYLGLRSAGASKRMPATAARGGRRRAAPGAVVSSANVSVMHG
jgi:hypothetical protein